MENSNDIAVTSRRKSATDPGGKKVPRSSIDDVPVKPSSWIRGQEFPNGVPPLPPDQSLLDVADYASRWIWSFQIQPGGSTRERRHFHRLEVLDEEGSAKPDGHDAR